jgi:hypothetical protein
MIKMISGKLDMLSDKVCLFKSLSFTVSFTFVIALDSRWVSTHIGPRGVVGFALTVRISAVNLIQTFILNI